MSFVISGFELTPQTILPQTTAHRSSNFFDNISNVDPDKNRPLSPSLIPRSLVMANTSSSSNSSGSMNPFHDGCRPHVEDLYNEPNVPRNSSAKNVKNYLNHLVQNPVSKESQPTYRHMGMSHSISEGNIGFHSYHNEDPAGRSHFTKLASNEILIRYSDESAVSSSSSHAAVSSSSSRGRKILRTPSPAKLGEIKEATSSTEELLQTVVKRPRSPMKQLFGEHGWLGKSMSMKELRSEEYRKKAGLRQWGGKLKERVEHLTPDMSKLDISSLASRLQSPSKSKSKSPPKTRFYISLSPPLQARLYSEVELMIVATANQYLQAQQREGRMSVNSFVRVLESWASKNRPQVIEFLFDQATQRELVLDNLKSFRFYGPHAESIVSVNSMMQNWKALAREMNVRNFCAPDVVVKKNLVDAFRVLEMLGAPVVTIVAFKEIKEKAEDIIAEKTKARKEYEKVKFGLERMWEPAIERTEGAGSNPYA